MCRARLAFFFSGPWQATQCLATNGTITLSNATAAAAIFGSVLPAWASARGSKDQPKPAATSRTTPQRYRKRMASNTLLNRA